MVLRIGYLSMAVFLLAMSLNLLRATSPLEGPAQLLVYGMVALAFPTGIGVVYLWGQAALQIQSTHSDSVAAAVLGTGSPAGLTILWLLLLVAGYLQWFVAMPAAIRRFRDRD